MRKVLVYYGPHHQRVWTGEVNRDWSPFANLGAAREWAAVNGYRLVDSSDDCERDARSIGQIVTVKPGRVFCNGVVVVQARRRRSARQRGTSPGGH